VQFTDTSTGGPTSWQWSFGDGATSTAQNPSHTFATAASYTVVLTATNSSGSKNVSRTVTVVPALVASFTFSPASPAVGQAVQFTDTSTGGPNSWLWDFGDGGTSTAQNPSHTFATVSSYTVVLTATNSSGSNSASRTINVVPSSTLVASFTYSPVSPAVGQSVQFTDTSTGGPTSWQWSFGDGGTSAAQNPSHSYATTGTKTVTLSVTNSTGSGSVNRGITVVSPSGIIINHSCTKLKSIPDTWINAAKQNLHIGYGTASHGAQIIFGMQELVKWSGGGSKYANNNGGTGGALDFRAYAGDFAGLGLATSLEYDAYQNVCWTCWNTATRVYLANHPEVNVMMWAWCWGAGESYSHLDDYFTMMEALERDFPNVKFVYMTGHTGPSDGSSGFHPAGNKYIRDYCIAHNKILYDFYDIECYDPDGVYYGDKNVDCACNYDSNGDGSRDRNWAIDWQNAHPGEWYQCEAPHSQPLNANLKAYAAWWLWARLAGWDGR
jgi:PKD repeat protein